MHHRKDQTLGGIMYKEAVIIKFPTSELAVLNDSDKKGWVELPIKIRDLETQEELDFDLFKWELGEVIGAGTRIFYMIEDRLGKQGLRFKIK